MVADLFPLQLATSRLHTLEGIPMLSLTMVSEDAPRVALKRSMDIAGAGILLLLLSPLFALVAFLIKITAPGPVFFLQERVGLNQRKFHMIKFRSMVVDAEARKEQLQLHNESDGPIFKIKNDPRVTPVGRWIRRLSIDELPQLVNVLKGDMSLVGPRPHPSKEVAKYNWHHRRRLSVKPGMTGLAQVSGRSSLAWEKTVDLDLQYIDTWSIWADILILFRTVKAVVSANGAT
jgi:exopolysaccharide biosynthesis polyprenyl glycosylphosphotransferase